MKRTAFTLPQAAVALLIAAFLIVFLIVPVGTVIYIAFADPDGGFTLSHFSSFFQLSLMRESFWNSLYVAALSVVFASLIALPLA
ncbi:MAG: iron ABC transporter permease, partial [Betaproteobacteria bacterium]|nr:iron ABC transporter permease [Betaproteobacteria bacterium]